MTYQTMTLLAIGGGTAILLDEGRRRGLGPRWIVAVLLWGIGGVVGAALPHEILGELAAPRTAVGAVAGATIAIFFAAAALRLSPNGALDATATAVPLAGALARLGCFVAECCQGIATNLPIGVIDESGVRRHPTQLYEAALDVVIAATVSRSRAERPTGHRFLFSLAAMSLGRFAIEFVRDSEKLGPLSLAQWITGAAALVAMALIAKRVELPEPRPRSVAVTALALQMPVISADTLYPRDYVSGGIGWFGSAFDWKHDVGGCDVEESWTRTHKIGGLSGEVAFRRQASATRGFGFRLRPFSATERASESRDALINGQPITGAPFPAYTVKSFGTTIAADIDFKYLGATIGASPGRFYPLFEGEDDDNDHRTGQSGWPAVGLRLGTQRVGLEARLGDEEPTGVPLPGFTIGIGIGNGKDTRVRLGASDMGPFIALRHVRPSGFEIDPIFGGAHEGWMAGIMVKQWFRTDGKR